jgi:ribosomal protein L11 methyltransferase
MSKKPSGLWQATVRLGDARVEAFADMMETGAAGVSMFETPDSQDGGWTVTALYRAEPDAAVLSANLALVAAMQGVAEPALEIAAIDNADWLAQAYAGFPARRIARFYIHGSHVDAPPPAGILALHIDAATAFGSGEHATTEGCLRAISALARRRPGPRTILDMGTGSGILAIGAAKIWPRARISGVDIDPESARVAAFNAKLNGVPSRVHAEQGDGYNCPLALLGPRFDLIVSNILARPLIRMAPALHRRLRPGGIAILSGLLARQAPAVLSAHRSAGLRLVGRVPIGEWQTLILRR